MPSAEFDIIARHFGQADLIAEYQPLIDLGGGDDCALITVPEGCQLALSSDILVEGVHFPAQAEPTLVAWRALAVNLSDLAAMGAKPLAFSLALSLPKAEESWLTAFGTGLREAARKYRCPLIGGDLSAGPLAISIQVQGLVARGKAIRRQGARPGDGVFVSGTLGKAALALDLLPDPHRGHGYREKLLRSYYQPMPRLQTGLALSVIASAGIDISDGLLADLGHICEQSGVGAEIQLEKIPVSETVLKIAGRQRALNYALSGGDDYELAFAVPPANAEQVEEVAAKTGVALTRIGEITAGKEVICLDAKGEPVTVPRRGYQHFRPHNSPNLPERQSS